MEQENKNETLNKEEKKEQPLGDTRDKPVREIHHHHYRKPGAFFGRLAWGLIIIFVGLLFLGQNAGIIQTSEIANFFSVFWPVLIIFIGLSVIARGGWVAGLISTLIMLGIFALFFAWLMGVPVLRTGTNVQMEVGEHQILVERNPLANAAEVRVRFGAGDLNISGSGEDLVRGTLLSSFMEPRTTDSIDGTIQRVAIEPEGVWGGFGRHMNRMDLSLSPTLPVSLSLESGASDLNLDLTNVTLSRLDIQTGASDLDVALGDLSSATDVSVKSGASDINISLPQSVGAKIDMRGGLSSQNFSKFSEVGDRVWESENYASAQKKINISIDAGVSSVNVNWR